MKAKLSFLVLPLSRGLVPALCFGLMIILVLAACGSGNPTNPGSGSSSPSGGGTSSGGVPGVIVFSSDFDVYTEGKYVKISGYVNATRGDPIVKVSFSFIGDGKLSWIEYYGDSENGKPLDGSTITVDDQKDFPLSSQIKLSNDEIQCDKTYSISIEAWTESGARAGDGGTFKKEGSELCFVEPSSGSQPSSSSVASWVFGEPTEGQVRGETATPIGSGTFTLKQDMSDPGMVDQPNIQIVGGKIRGTVTVCNDDQTISAGTDGNVIPGFAYSSKNDCLGSTPATSTNLGEEEGLQPRDYYLVYLDDGNVYLLFFTAGEGGGVSRYPLKYIYWRAAEHP